MASHLSPATKVVIFQWPCGTLPIRRLPRRQRPSELGHVGAGAGLIDEDEARGIKQSLIDAPALAGGRHVGAILLAGVDAFFKAEFAPVVDAPHRPQADTHAAPGKASHVLPQG